VDLWILCGCGDDRYMPVGDHRPSGDAHQRKFDVVAGRSECLEQYFLHLPAYLTALEGSCVLSILPAVAACSFAYCMTCLRKSASTRYSDRVVENRR
jgi:hypothetical protein